MEQLSLPGFKSNKDERSLATMLGGGIGGGKSGGAKPVSIADESLMRLSNAIAGAFEPMFKVLSDVSKFLQELVGIQDQTLANSIAQTERMQARAAEGSAEGTRAKDDPEDDEDDDEDDKEKPKMTAKKGLLIFAAIVAGILFIKQAIEKAIEKFKANLKDGILPALLKSIGSFLGNTVGTILDFFKGIVAKIFRFFGFEEIADYLESFSIKDNIIALFEGLGNFVKSIIDGIKSIAEKVLRFIPGGKKIADKLFGADSDQAKAKQIDQEQEKQEDADKKIAKLKERRKRVEASYTEKGKQGEKFKSVTADIDRQIAEQEGIKDEAATRSLAIQTAGKDVDVSIQAAQKTGADQEKILKMLKEKFGIDTEGMTDAEKQKVLDRVNQMMSADQIAKQEEIDTAIADDTLGVKDKKRRRRSRQEVETDVVLTEEELKTGKRPTDLQLEKKDGQVVKKIIDGKEVELDKKEKQMGEMLNQAGGVTNAPVVNAPINKGGDNNSITNISNVSGGGGSGGDSNAFNPDPSAFRLQSAQGQL